MAILDLKNGEEEKPKIDMCYVLDNVIAMSFPWPTDETNPKRLNRIDKVGAFLDAEHKDNYKVVSFAGELQYQDNEYFHQRIERFPIIDFNVPALKNALEFLKRYKKLVEANPTHTTAFHCWGGKGRTGTMMSMLLLYLKKCATAKEAMAFFAAKRNVGEHFKGVETPSQARFVGYFERIMNEFNGEMPAEKHLLFDKIVLRSKNGILGDDIAKWHVQISSNDKATTTMLCIAKKKKSKYTVDENGLTITLKNDFDLLNEVKLEFFSLSKKIPKKEEGCTLLVSFHTSFIDPKTNSLIVPRDEIDHLNEESPLWEHFKEDFSVELYFKNA